MCSTSKCSCGHLSAQSDFQCLKQFLRPYNLFHIPHSTFLEVELYKVLSGMHSILRNHRYRQDTRTLEDEEEMWFNTDEDDMEDGEPVVSPSDKTKNDEDIMGPISKFMERKKLKESEEKEVLLKTNPSGRQSPSFKLSLSNGTKTNLTSQSPTANLPGSSGSPGSPGSPGTPGSVPKSTSQMAAITTKGGLVGLVDYPDDDEDDDEDEDKEETPPLLKKAKFES
ncbi:Serine/threonine-protein phosphatase 4 regulatory subunit 3A [Heterocephalus glaber]|uniref:Serine/threonine-protein phosphatase 4 regulatory subunit 3A n=1 Tax=Heterocephalus glaber TaxID=10181 RepID=G5BMN0_HETGA|nr:Serine/threonine-protein phosphatase 4 regulatory subunit 3A [Heterocephalus glaber]